MDNDLKYNLVIKNYFALGLPLAPRVLFAGSGEGERATADALERNVLIKE